MSTTKSRGARNLTIVPPFMAVDVFGNPVKISVHDSDYTLLVFLRYSGCPWCNLAIHRLSLEYKQLQAQNCQVIAFVQSERDNVIKNIYDRHELKPQFPVIADQEMKYYKQFNVTTSMLDSVKTITKVPYWVRSVRKHGYKQGNVDGNLFLVPAWFLINNRQKRVIKSQRGVSFYDHDTFIDIYDSLIFKD